MAAGNRWAIVQSHEVRGRSSPSPFPLRLQSQMSLTHTVDLGFLVYVVGGFLFMTGLEKHHEIAFAVLTTVNDGSVVVALPLISRPYLTAAASTAATKAFENSQSYPR